MTIVPNLARWNRKFLADGIAFCPPPDLDFGMLVYKERLRPLRSAQDILNREVAAMPAAFQNPVIGPIETLLTNEGEYAAIGTITAQIVEAGNAGTAANPTDAVQRTIGIIFGDDFYTLIDAVVKNAENFAGIHRLVRSMVEQLSLGLGEQRRRYFLYTPPPAWQGLSRGLNTEWYPPEFPNDFAMMLVRPVKPIRESNTAAALDHLLHEDNLRGFQQDAPQRSEPIALPNGLRGQLVQISGAYPNLPRTFFDMAILQDSRFTYSVRLESREPGRSVHRATLLAVIQSICPIPSAATASSSSILWVD